MRLEDLKGFDWYNEPENVIFNGAKMIIAAKPETDFWQSCGHGFNKDDGHFFYKQRESDFVMSICWSFDDVSDFKQCGVMVRVDEGNWFKSALMCRDIKRPEIGHCLTVMGNSDWAAVQLATTPMKLWYRVVRRKNDYLAFYSLNGTDYIKMRQFYLTGENVCIGAYICNPQHGAFSAALEDVSFS